MVMPNSTSNEGVRVEIFLASCQAAVENHGGLMLTLFMGGLMGGFTHCAGMCGPFVVAQVVAPGQPDRQEMLARVRGAALAPYHAGRMTTYVVLGVVAAGLSGAVFGSSLQQAVSVILLLIAALLFLMSAMPVTGGLKLGPKAGGALGEAIGRSGQLLGRAARPFFDRPTHWRRYGLGLILGFLPCGMLAAALMAVASTADMISAAFAMAAFCVGTIPALFLVGSGSQFALARWPAHRSGNLKTVARGVMVFNGVTLTVIAGGMIL